MNRFMKKLDEPKDNLKRHPCTIVEAWAFLYSPSERMGVLDAFTTKGGIGAHSFNFQIHFTLGIPFLLGLHDLFEYKCF